jgi:CubicO group peptidase (beta-lactamase class C family)
MRSMSRRDVFALGLLAAIPAAMLPEFARAATAANPASMRVLDKFIAGYCDAMNAPGMTLGLAAADGPLRTSSYGHVDVAAKIPVSPSHLFEIGSISKSFVAMVVLQLHDEGKVDLQAPIHSYLPWLSMQTNFGEILIHHLLTHSSGMPDDPPLFPNSPQRRPRQALKPGSEFHYCNWGYDVLGRLIETVDRRPWSAAVTERIFKPLGMSDTVPTITSAVRSRIAQSYMPLHDDRPYPRHAPIVPAGNLAVEFAAGSIASTPKDMNLYMQMILNRGESRGRRIISEESFKLFSTRHIDAPAFGPTAGYGYGIAVDTLDGHVRLRHTGGMVSFMSAMHLDLDSRLGAFASINAQLGYRPNPVAQFALQLLRADKEHAKAPAMPEFDPALKVADAQSYGAVYTAGDGRRIEIKDQTDRLILISAGQTIPLQQSDDGSFIADHPGFDLFPIVFERTADAAPVAAAAAPTAPAAAADASKAAITALAYGGDWFARAGYKGRAPLQPSPQLAKYVGKYYSENPWNGVIRVVQRQGQLWMGGTDPLTPIGNDLFKVGEEASSLDVVEFSEAVNEAFNLLWFNGVRFQRIEDVNS